MRGLYIRPFENKKTLQVLSNLLLTKVVFFHPPENDTNPSAFARSSGSLEASRLGLKFAKAAVLRCGRSWKNRKKHRKIHMFLVPSTILVYNLG